MENVRTPRWERGRGFQRGDHPGLPGVGESFHETTLPKWDAQGAEAVQVLWRAVEVVEDGELHLAILNIRSWDNPDLGWRITAMSDQAERYRKFEEALAQTRQEKGLTQAEVAERLSKPQSFVSKYESGERRLDVIEFIEVCEVLGVDPDDILNKFSRTEAQQTIFHYWGITPAQLTQLIHSNPSLRGMVLGYVAEYKAQEMFTSFPEIVDLGKDDDHDRKKKGDRRIRYKDRVLRVEVKSLQTNTVKNGGEDEWSGKFQCDASDRRTVQFPDGTTLDTTLLLRGEFDVLAVNCFAFGDKWRFAFARNQDLPTAQYSKYTSAQKEALIASLISITWPPKAPFSDDLMKLLDRVVTSVPEVEVAEKEKPVVAERTILEVKPK